MVVTDHGFTHFDHKVHLNRWLLDKGDLVSEPFAETGNLQTADWSRTKAYGIGLNSLYLNLKGREGEGIVGPDEQDNFSQKLRKELLEWQDPNGKFVFQEVRTQKEVFEGSISEWGPDLVMGYAPGFRASADTGLGGWEPNAFQPNHDHCADHCIAPSAVQGVLFSNRGLSNIPQPSYKDIP